MDREEEAEILRTLMGDLEAAFKLRKASRAITHAQNAYMRAAFNRSQIERHRAMVARRGEPTDDPR